jgi:hypothetical protein
VREIYGPTRTADGYWGIKIIKKLMIHIKDKTYLGLSKNKD